MTKGIFRKVIENYGLLVIFAGVFIFFSIKTPTFFSGGNMITLVRYTSEMLLLVLGFTLVFIAGEFDLSFMYLFPLVSIILAFLCAVLGWPTSLALLIAIIVAILAGLGNGVLTVYVGLPSFFATISIAFICYGLIHFITGPFSIPCYLPTWFSFIGKGFLGGLPFNIVITGLIYVGVIFVAEKTRFGRHLYALGENLEAARNIGVKVNLYKMLAFVIATFIYGVGAIMFTSRLSSGIATVGPEYMLPVFASVFLGMTMFKVGRATIYGALIGAFFMNTIVNGLTQMGMPFYWQQFISGIVLIGAVSVTIAREKIEI